MCDAQQARLPAGGLLGASKLADYLKNPADIRGWRTLSATRSQCFGVPDELVLLWYAFFNLLLSLSQHCVNLKRIT